MEIALRLHVVVKCILSNISGYTGLTDLRNVFTI